MFFQGLAKLLSQVLGPVLALRVEPLVLVLALTVESLLTPLSTITLEIQA